jgi:Fe-S-cluster containining protein
MQRLVSRREYAQGEAPFPDEVTRADAIAIAADVHRAVDLAAEKRAEVARRRGSPVACHAGCNACCEQLVMIWGGEAELIAEWLDEPEQAEIRSAFLEAYPSWLERSTPAIDRVMALTAAGDAKGQFAALVDHWRQRILCAFNAGGMCTIYPVRPVLCRNAHALDTPANCHPADDTGTAATSLHFAPLDDFLRKTRSLAMAVHHARGGKKKQPEPLPTAVFERLLR